MGFASGVAADCLRQWGASWMSSRGVRNAIRAEIHPVLVHLNFFILNAMEGERDQGQTLTGRYFAQPLRLQAFDYYWQDRRDCLLKLQEWPRLKNWAEALNRIGDDPGSALFTAIMLFESLMIPPLDRCMSRDTKTFARGVLERPEVAEYQRGQLLRKAGF
jgi:hypothetical protein